MDVEKSMISLIGLVLMFLAAFIILNVQNNDVTGSFNQGMENRVLIPWRMPSQAVCGNGFLEGYEQCEPRDDVLQTNYCKTPDGILGTCNQECMCIPL